MAPSNNRHSGVNKGPVGGFYHLQSQRLETDLKNALELERYLKLAGISTATKSNIV